MIINQVRGSWVVVGVALAVVACSSSSNPVTGGDSGLTADASPVDQDSAVADASVDSAPDAGPCSAAIQQALNPINRVAMTPVAILSDSGGTRVISVDATAGGSSGAPNNPYVYVNLETATRVDVTDVAARMSTGWDLALKRYVVYTNDGDGGPGMGGAVSSTKDFASVTSADATGLKTEVFFDASCNVLTDMIGGLQTTFSNWYAYDQMTNRLTPKPEVFIVRGGTGKLFKVQILSYYGSADGGAGTGTGADFVLQVAAL